MCGIWTCLIRSCIRLGQLEHRVRLSSCIYFIAISIISSVSVWPPSRCPGHAAYAAHGTALLPCGLSIGSEDSLGHPASKYLQSLLFVDRGLGVVSLRSSLKIYTSNPYRTRSKCDRILNVPAQDNPPRRVPIDNDASTSSSEAPTRPATP